MDLKEKIRGALRLGSGMEFQAAGLMYEKARFPYLLSLMRGTVMRPASAERKVGRTR